MVIVDNSYHLQNCCAIFLVGDDTMATRDIFINYIPFSKFLQDLYYIIQILAKRIRIM